MGKKSQQFLADFFNIGIQHEAGGARGRDPRELTPAQLADHGHAPISPLQALRATCIAHLGTAPRVRGCTATACPAWPFRLGKHPYKKKSVLTDEQKRDRAARVGVARAKKLADLEAKKKSPNGERTKKGPRGRG